MLRYKIPARFAHLGARLSYASTPGNWTALGNAQKQRGPPPARPYASLRLPAALPTQAPAPAAREYAATVAVFARLHRTVRNKNLSSSRLIFLNSAKLAARFLAVF